MSQRDMSMFQKTCLCPSKTCPRYTCLCPRKTCPCSREAWGIPRPRRGVSLGGGAPKGWVLLCPPSPKEWPQGNFSHLSIILEPESICRTASEACHMFPKSSITQASGTLLHHHMSEQFCDACMVNILSYLRELPSYQRPGNVRSHASCP